MDINKEIHKEDTFILALQVKRVFYITDPAKKKWSIILYTKITTDCDSENNIGDNINKVLSFSLRFLSREDNTDGNDVKE